MSYELPASLLPCCAVLSEAWRANYELRVTNYELRITSYELRVTNYLPRSCFAEQSTARQGKAGELFSMFTLLIIVKC